MDYYLLLCQKESEILQAIKDTKIITLFKENNQFKSEINSSSNYGVVYLGKNICKFSIKNSNDGTIIINIKKRESIITDKKSINEFVNILIKYVIQIFEDYQKIKKTYYINRINYHNEIYLKKPLHSIFYRVININFDNTYSIFLNTGDVINYNSIEEVLQSLHLIEAKRTMFYNMLKKIKII